MIILVWNEAGLRTALEGADGLYAAAAPGRVFIDMSTQLPATAREEGAAFAAREVRLCLVMDKTNNLIELVWYKNLRTRDDSIQHLGDSVTGQDRGRISG